MGGIQHLKWWLIFDPQKQDFDCYNFPVARDRNYRRFAALAGVRGGDEDPVPLGFPNDASETSKLLWDEDGGHSPSWMAVKEATAIFLKTDTNIVRWNVPDPEEYYFDLGGLDLEEFRIVFWFSD